MAVMRCKSCGEVSLPDDQCRPAEVCTYCGSSDLECDHPSSHFDQVSQSFVCSWCGQEESKGLGSFRSLAKIHPELGMQDVVDIANH